MFNGARILVAPLDWGLGHATRCVPIIRRLIASGATPIIGADKGPLAVLRAEFPELEHTVIPGMDVRYTRGASQGGTLARQFPRMLRSVRDEHAELMRSKEALRLDAVISDQRFGLHAQGLPSVLITHQVFPFAPFGQRLVRRINQRMMMHFDAIWIPDHAEAPGLAGALSHGPLPKQARYIGPISRLDPASAIKPGTHYATVAVISGPEPQRTLLEEKLLRRMQALPGAHMLVRGKPGSGAEEQRGNVTVLPHADAPTLAGLLLDAGRIISRTGYTTLMDLDALGRTALLIPTPGQPEQEYLGGLHARTGLFHVQQQSGLDLDQAPPASARPAFTAPGEDLLERALQALATRIRQR
ncbi:MAG: glycosyltransferase [Flavobacteriales bacterium]